MITGRKRVEGAIGGGMLGRLKTKCLSRALKTRNCVSLLNSGRRGKGEVEKILTCHASGTFLRFTRTKRATAIRE